MPQLRRDPIVGRWVIVNIESPLAPSDFELEAHQWRQMSCPFCSGNEKMTPPEIVAIRQADSLPNTSGWQVRVIPNKFPALQIEGDLDKRGLGMFDMSNGIGAHEVIVETPHHGREMADLSEQELEMVISQYKGRSLDLRKDKRFKYILIFKNYGQSAGASLQHAHTQLIALPMVPKNVNEELKGANFYFNYRERCIFCDIIRQELEGERLVSQNQTFLLFSPYVSRFPFELWIVPKEHRSDFGLIKKEEIVDLSKMLKEALLRIKVLLGDPSYNFIIHTAPLFDGEREDYHWHMEIIPKLMRVAGFEGGSGFYIVPTPPELAARYLREVKINGS